MLSIDVVDASRVIQLYSIPQGRCTDFDSVDICKYVDFLLLFLLPSREHGSLCIFKPNPLNFEHLQCVSERGRIRVGVSYFFFFFFFDSMDLRATSSLVLRRTGNVRLPLCVVRSCRESLP